MPVRLILAVALAPQDAGPGLTGHTGHTRQRLRCCPVGRVCPGPASWESRQGF